MSSTSRAWGVAVSIAAVEALKDQGICRWNHSIRSLHQHAKNRARSLSQANKLSSSPSPAAACGSNTAREENKTSKQEESLRKVMYLSCWGPY